MNDRYTNSRQNGFTMRDRHLLDLLVDGELAEDQRHELLAGLDDTPDGWRRCALAFLEAQSWLREMGAVASEPADGFAKSPSATSAAASAELPRSIAVGAQQIGRKVRVLNSPLAMAASVLVAFVLGLAMRPSWNDMTTGTTTAGRADNNAGSTDAVQRTVQTSDDQRPSADADSPMNERDDVRHETGRWGTAKLVVENGPEGGSRELELPAVESDSWDESLLASSPSVISPELLELFERLGHEVRQERELVPVQLDDGRQMVVPVDKLSFTPVANRSYQ